MMYHSHRNNIEYAAKGKDCRACAFKSQCTTDNNGRSVQRHIRKKQLDEMILITKSYKALRDIKMRQHLMERSYARSIRYGFDHASWRGLYKVSIQEYLICAIQNIEVLIRHMRKPLKGTMARPLKDILKQKIIRGGRYILDLIRFFMYQIHHQFYSGIWKDKVYMLLLKYSTRCFG